MTYLGNRLDKYCQSTMAGQTSGIPIGPDTSSVLGEIIASAIDSRIETAESGVSGFRYADDYRLFTKSKSDAERLLTVVREAAREFELELNPTKTNISEIPFGMEAAWIRPLRTHEFRSKPGIQKSNLISYFSIATNLQSIYPDDRVFRYAVSRVSQFEI